MQTISIAGTQALSELKKLRADYARSGLFPVLLGDDEELRRLTECMSFSDQDAATLISLSYGLDAPAWLAKNPIDERDEESPPDGDWPTDAPVTPRFVAHIDPVTNLPKQFVNIGLLPVGHPWEVFAELRWGNFNGCPRAEVHCAVLRYWQEQYGANVVSISSDVVQCAVRRPPRDRKSALALAREQYCYSGDIVDQGVGSVSALAASLIDAPYWFFWWD